MTGANVLILLGSALIAFLIGAVDYFADPELSLRVFYLLPILLATWFAGGLSGIAMSVLCAAIWLAAEIGSHSYRIFWAPYWNFAFLFVFYFSLAFVLSRLKRAYEHQSAMASSDPLTGALNRRRFEEQAEVEIYRARRSLRPLSTVYIDLDNFKKVNDTMGHRTGDELLRQVAETFKARIRKTDLFVRLGGDEFILLLPEASSEEAKKVILSIKEIIAQDFKAKNYPVTLSVGIATFNCAPPSVEEMIHKADELMYQVKLQSKNDIKTIVIADANSNMPIGEGK